MWRSLSTWGKLLSGWLLLLFVEYHGLSATEPMYFQRIGLRQGLSQSTVFSITQDTTGFIWLATADGLNRYDGYTFTVYRPDPRDPASLSELGVRRVFTDRVGNLWVVTLGGRVERYLPHIDGFRHYRFPVAKHRRERTAKIVALTQSPEGTLWLGSASGELFYYTSAPDSFQRLVPAIPLPRGTRLQCLLAEGDTVLWLGTWQGLFRYEPSTGELSHFVHTEGVPGSLGGNLVFDLALDGAGNLWVATADGGVSMRAPQSDSFLVFTHHRRQPNSLSSNRTMCVFVDDFSRVWVGTVDAGVNLYDPVTGTFHCLHHHSALPNSLGSGAIMCIFQDTNGGLWFGTSSSGVSRLDPRRQAFRQFTHRTEDPTSLSHNTVLAVLEDRAGGLWIGTDGGGLNYRPPGKEEFTHFLQHPGSMGSNSITALYEDREGRIWVGTDPGVRRRMGAILIYHPETGTLEPFRQIPITFGGVACFYQDRSGVVWIGTVANGLYGYHPESGQVEVFQHRREDSGTISGNAIFSITEDRQGNLWIGTYHAGLNRLNRKTGTITRFRANPKDTTCLSNNTVWCLYADDSGNVWIGTWGGGLNEFLSASGCFRRYTVADGLPGNIINSIVPDAAGNLWLGTNQGICRFNPGTGEVRNFDYSDGLTGNEFNPGAACRGSDGTLYFGGNEGLTAFHPRRIRRNRHVPPVVLTGFRVFDRPLKLKQSIGTVREVSLSYRQNFFTIGFAALDFTAPEKNCYAYRLEGVDPEWVQAGHRRTASYTNIAPGTYVFKVKGSNNDGIWNQHPVTLTIHITPPFWQTGWFRLLALSGLVALLVLLHRYRLHRLLEVERTRLRIARDLHDDISGTLTGIVYFTDALEKELVHRKSPAIRHLLGLLRESSASVQEAMGEIIWSINPENDRWELFLPRIRRFTSELCESKGIRYRIDIPENPPARPLEMSHRRHLWLVVKEMVVNAVKHSRCSELQIRIWFDAGHLHVTVADDGCGFDVQHTSGGNGLHNITNRVKQLNGTVHLNTGRGKGTRWELTIPL